MSPDVAKSTSFSICTAVGTAYVSSQLYIGTLKTIKLTMESRSKEHAGMEYLGVNEILMVGHFPCVQIQQITICSFSYQAGRGKTQNL